MFRFCLIAQKVVGKKRNFGRKINVHLLSFSVSLMGKIKWQRREGKTNLSVFFSSFSYTFYCKQ